MSQSDKIQLLGGNTVHLICSGQVVLSLAIAVKELVENSLDAGATHVEVRVTDYGSEAVEIVDNGCGVRSENFEGLTLKHCTSKLREFDDLTSIETLGFRGEALSSLCALGKLTITTQHASSEHGTRIFFDSNGAIVSKTIVARGVGTTVLIENLFSSLPVRRKEFVKNLKREFNKMCQLLHAYCLVCKGVKFTCFNRLKSGGRSAILTTEGSNSIRDNIVSIFGTKLISTLIDVPLVEPNTDILNDFSIKSYDSAFCTFEFLISNAADPMSGRSSNDHQFYYINSRPVEFPKASKLINDIYRQFVCNRYPFVYLNVIMSRSMVDVNVMPDKRQFFVEREKLLLAVLKSSLLEVFKCHPSTHSIRNFDCGSSQKLKQTLLSISQDTTENYITPSRGVKREMEEKIFSLLAKKSCKQELNFSVLDVSQSDQSIEQSMDCDTSASVEEDDNKYKLPSENKQSSKLSMDCDTSVSVEEDDDKKYKLSSENKQSSKLRLSPVHTTSTSNFCKNDKTAQLEKISPEKSCIKNREKSPTEKPYKTPTKKRKENALSEESESSTLLALDVDTDNSKKSDWDPTSFTIRSSISYINKAIQSCQSKKRQTDDTIKIQFKSEIDPSTNERAEQELEKQLTKDKFKEMEIIGQFNLGFIITRLGDDLFIIDQHASDEKYNFEQLQLSTIMEKQHFVKAQPLELTAGSEELLIENVEVFHKNGFNFDIDLKAPATKKVALAAVPTSKSFVFGKDDIEEMLFAIKKGASYGIIRPLRIKSMFASRACRKSVMVGCPLTMPDMKRLVEHMGEIQQPWNCPHGRPTMRHLINLKLIENSNFLK